MRKKLLTTLIVIACSTLTAFSQQTISQQEMNQLIYEVNHNPQALENIKNNPQEVNKILQELQTNPAMMQKVQQLYNNQELRNALIKKIQTDPSIAQYITSQLVNNPALTKKILVGMGKSTKTADEMARNPQLRRQMAQKVQNDPEFMRKVWMEMNTK